MCMAQNEMRLTSTNHGTTISSTVLKRFSSSSSTRSIHLRDWAILEWEYQPRNGEKRFTNRSCPAKAVLHKAVIAQAQQEIAMVMAAPLVERKEPAQQVERKELVRQEQLQLGRVHKLLNRHHRRKHPLNHTCNHNLRNTNNHNKGHITRISLRKLPQTQTAWLLPQSPN